jgi:hypothetical protein
VSTTLVIAVVGAIQSGTKVGKTQRMNYVQIAQYASWCVDHVAAYYKEHFDTQQSQAIFTSTRTASTLFPYLFMRVSPAMQHVYVGAGMNETSMVQLCTLNSVSSYNICPNSNGISITTGAVFTGCTQSYTETFTVHSLFSGIDVAVRDVASRLALGEKVSPGEVW